MRCLAEERTGEERRAVDHLGEDASDGPEVDLGGVVDLAQQQLGAAIPHRDDLVLERANVHGEGAREPEVGELEDARAVQQQVRGLEVAVQHLLLVAEGEALEQLVEQGLDCDDVEAGIAGVEVLLEVELKVLEDHGELVHHVNHVVHHHNVLVLKELEQGDLTNRRGGDAFLFDEADRLEGDRLGCLFVLGLVDDAVGALADTVENLVAVHTDFPRTIDKIDRLDVLRRSTRQRMSERTEDYAVQCCAKL